MGNKLARCKNCGVLLEDFGEVNGIYGLFPTAWAINSDCSDLCSVCRVKELKSNKWQEWLKKHMTPEHTAKVIERIHENLRKWQQGDAPASHYMSITSGSLLDWASSGSPLPLDENGKPYIPKSPLSMIRCWYCGGPNEPKRAECKYCGAPVQMEN